MTYVGVKSEVVDHYPLKDCCPFSPRYLTMVGILSILLMCHFLLQEFMCLLFLVGNFLTGKELYPVLPLFLMGSVGRNR